MNIREYIINNFKNTNIKEIEEAINASINDKEITLPGLGVFFEIIWTNSNPSQKQAILETLKNNIK